MQGDLSLCDHLINANRMTTAGADKALKAWEDLIGSMEFKDSAK